MNFLAHLYLSGNDEMVMVGNFIADHVKGQTWQSYPDGIKKGIQLHRYIDEFTDHHPEVEKSKSLLRPDFNKYTPVICDIYYDHFLAASWSQYSTVDIEEYSKRIYELLHRYESYLPERTKAMMVYMERDNWLKNYATLQGLDRALKGMSRRAKFENNMHKAADFLEMNYSAFKKHFNAFFPELVRSINVIGG
jgi:acyl carrier protein phosphodiesterase